MPRTSSTRQPGDITTIQRLYSILRGEPDWTRRSTSIPLTSYRAASAARSVYNPALPIESFDFVIVDECHRSIYGLWRQVLDYFDAFIIGLTATPDKQTFGFFHQNLVMEYTHDQAVADMSTSTSTCTGSRPRSPSKVRG